MGRRTRGKPLVLLGLRGGEHGFGCFGYGCLWGGFTVVVVTTASAQARVKTASPQALCLPPSGAKLSLLARWWFGLRRPFGPNNTFKGTRRPLAVLKFGFYQSSAASLKLSERRAPYRNVRLLWNPNEKPLS